LDILFGPAPEPPKVYPIPEPKPFYGHYVRQPEFQPVDVDHDKALAILGGMRGEFNRLIPASKEDRGALRVGKEPPRIVDPSNMDDIVRAMRK
jgi:hypothetical protein